MLNLLNTQIDWNNVMNLDVVKNGQLTHKMEELEKTENDDVAKALAILAYMVNTSKSIMVLPTGMTADNRNDYTSVITNFKCIFLEGVFGIDERRVYFHKTPCVYVKKMSDAWGHYYKGVKSDADVSELIDIKNAQGQRLLPNNYKNSKKDFEKLCGDIYDLLAKRFLVSKAHFAKQKLKKLNPFRKKQTGSSGASVGAHSNSMPPLPSATTKLGSDPQSNVQLPSITSTFLKGPKSHPLNVNSKIGMHRSHSSPSATTKLGSDPQRNVQSPSNAPRSTSSFVKGLKSHLPNVNSKIGMRGRHLSPDSVHTVESTPSRNSEVASAEASDYGARNSTQTKPDTSINSFIGTILDFKEKYIHECLEQVKSVEVELEECVDFSKKTKFSKELDILTGIYENLNKNINEYSSLESVKNLLLQTFEEELGQSDYVSHITDPRFLHCLAPLCACVDDIVKKLKEYKASIEAFKDKFNSVLGPDDDTVNIDMDPHSFSDELNQFMLQSKNWRQREGQKPPSLVFKNISWGDDEANHAGINSDIYSRFEGLKNAVASAIYDDNARYNNALRAAIQVANQCSTRFLSLSKKLDQLTKKMVGSQTYKKMGKLLSSLKEYKANA